MPSDRRSQHRVILYRAEVPDDAGIHEVRYDSVADALHFACRDLRNQRRRPLSIVEDGTVVMDADQIRRVCAEERAEMESRLEPDDAEEEEDRPQAP